MKKWYRESFATLLVLMLILVAVTFTSAFLTRSLFTPKSPPKSESPLVINPTLPVFQPNQQDPNSGHFIPSTPPDLTSNEEPCLGTYLGAPQGEMDSNGRPLPTPTHIPVTSCQKIYSEKHLSFKYPCNWAVVPVVKDEISPSCGFVRDFYLLAGKRQSGYLTVNPLKDTTLADYISNANVSRATCTPKTIGTINGYLCSYVHKFFAYEQRGILVTLTYGLPEDDEIFNKILFSIQLKYPASPTPTISL